MIVRKTGGAVPRLRLISVPPKRGNRFRTFISFALSFMLVASGFYGATSLAQAPPVWGGTVEVEVEGSVSALTLRAGESVSYRIRLTEEPLADQNDGEWFVRIHVNDVVLIDGIYPPGNRDDAMITWVPSVGWEFDRGNWDQWRTITIRAHKNITTPIRFMHEVWATSEWCPIHNVGKITVSSEPTPPDGPVLRAEKNGKSQIDLTWVAPDDNGASISRYALQVSDDGASGWTNLASSLGASARAYSHTSLSPGTEKVLPHSGVQLERRRRVVERSGPRPRSRTRRARRCCARRRTARRRSTSPGMNRRLTASGHHPLRTARIRRR